jgi:hypothetical protein
MISRSRGHHSLFSPELRGDEDARIERQHGLLDLGSASSRPLLQCWTGPGAAGNDDAEVAGQAVLTPEDEAHTLRMRNAAAAEPISCALPHANQRKQALALKELQDTEAAYLRRLELVQELFVAPLRKVAPSIVTLPLLHSIFHNLDSVVELSRLFLAHIIGSGLSGTEDLLVSMREAYAEYAARFTSSADALTGLLRTSAAFAQFVSAQESEAEVRLGIRLGLPALLLEPIQRVPRYELLFRQILRYTDEHREGQLYELTNRCLVLAHEIALDVNRSSSQEEVEILRKAEARLHGPLAHIALGCSGAPIDQGFFHVKTVPLLTKVSLAAIHSFQDGEKRWCILFDNIFVVARRSQLGGGEEDGEVDRYVCEHLLHLRDISILQVEDKIISLRRRSGSAEPVLFLLAQSPEEAAAWMESFRK